MVRLRAPTSAIWVRILGDLPILFLIHFDTLRFKYDFKTRYLEFAKPNLNKFSNYVFLVSFTGY